jgi:hypothetical protein
MKQRIVRVAVSACIAAVAFVPTAPVGAASYLFISNEYSNGWVPECAQHAHNSSGGNASQPGVAIGSVYAYWGSTCTGVLSRPAWYLGAQAWGFKNGVLCRDSGLTLNSVTASAQSASVNCVAPMTSSRTHVWYFWVDHYREHDATASP